MKLPLSPVRLSRAPGFHWFGYYDKYQFDPTDRYALGMRVDFEHRLYNGDDTIRIGMIDLAEGSRWAEIGQSRAWSWQQGCMLQWRPGSDHEVLWNDREGDRFVCRVLNTETGKLRTLPMAVGTVSACGKSALCEDFSRLWNFRPGYAYAGIPDPQAGESAPAERGVWRMDMDTGEVAQIISLAELAAIPYPGQAPEGRHYVQHLSWSPDGERFLMFHRRPGIDERTTRVFTAKADGSDLRLLSKRGASHFTWCDSEHLLIWCEDAYRLYRDNGSGEPLETVWEHPNGHQTYIPGTNQEWLLTDTYPRTDDRHQELCLYHLPSKTKHLLTTHYSPAEYRSEWRCDLHPRLNRQGTKVTIDSPHEGNGRQMYLYDIEPIIRAG